MASADGGALVGVSAGGCPAVIASRSAANKQTGTVRNPNSILITGASSGIGEALAHSYAQKGRFLALTGRDAARVEAVGALCRAKGSEVEARVVDVTDADAMAAFVKEMDVRAPLDLVIANAGISAGTGSGSETDAQARRIFATNVDGVLNTAMPAIQRFQQRASPGAREVGQVAVVASLAAFMGFPGAPAYCASKAAVRVWAEAQRHELAPFGIEVSVICPGFVRSRMTAPNDFRMPLLMDADHAARIIRRGLARNRGCIAFPWRLYASVRLGSALPQWVKDRALGRLPKKA
jgi:short-subunit dehydrogenase